MQIKDALGLGSKPLENKEKTQAARKSREGGQGESSGTQAQSAGGDRVDLSGRSKEMAKAHEVLSNTPAVRKDKVAEIRERIERQEYQVDSEKLAHKMIRDFLEDIV